MNPGGWGRGGVNFQQQAKNQAIDKTKVLNTFTPEEDGNTLFIKVPVTAISTYHWPTQEVTDDCFLNLKMQYNTLKQFSNYFFNGLAKWKRCTVVPSHLNFTPNV